MEPDRACFSLGIALLYLFVSGALFIHCDARKPLGPVGGSGQFKRLRTVKHTFLEQMMTQLNLAQPLGSSGSPNTQPYGVSSPNSLPPYGSLPPTPVSTENAPPYCTYPPNAPQAPGLTNPSPGAMSPPNLPPPGPPGPPETINPSPPSGVPGPPETSNPTPPSGNTPGTPGYIPSPSVNPNPPGSDLNPPNPPVFTPSPPLFLPPIVFPPPTVPPSPRRGPSTALWCVAKPSVPDPIIQEAMNYACASGADCKNIQPNGPCFKPDTLYAHASYAFNSYWQRTKVAGGTCEFGGTGMLVTIDPSYDGCHFEYY